jgi:hypothetical protein
MELRAENDIGPYKRHELLTGRIYYPALGYTGCGDGKSTNPQGRAVLLSIAIQVAFKRQRRRCARRTRPQPAMMKVHFTPSLPA